MAREGEISGAEKEYGLFRIDLNTRAKVRSEEEGRSRGTKKQGKNEEERAWREEVTNASLVGLKNRINH